MRKAIFLVFLCGIVRLFAGCDCVNRLYVGGQAYAYRLQIEGDDVPNAFTGCLGGAVLGYEYKEPDGLYAALEASYAQGTIETSGTGNNRRKIDDGLLELRVGYDWSLDSCCSLFLAPYTGLGFRWNRQHRLPGTLAGLVFNYYKITIPLGFVLNYIPNDTVNVGIDFTWLPDVLSMVSLSSLKGGFWKLERMNNYSLEVPCIFTFTDCIQLGITPFWRHWWDGQSIAVADGGMPLGLDKQMTNNWGGVLSLGVTF